MIPPVYDIKKSHVTRAVKHAAPLIACRFGPIGDSIFASSQDGTAVRWNLAGEAKAVYAGHESWVFALGFCDEGRTLLTAAGDGRLKWWDSTGPDPKAKHTVEAHAGWARCLAVSPDGQTVASGGNDNLVKLWSAGDGKPIRTLTGHANRVYSVAFHPDGKHLLTGDLVGSVRVWELASGKEVATLDAKELHTYEAGQAVDFGGVRGLTVNGDGSRVACGGLYKATNPLGAVHQPLAVTFDWATRKKICIHTAPGVAGGVIWRLRYLPDQTLVGVCGGSTGGLLLFWRPEEEKEAHRFALPNLARDFDLHPSQPLAVTVHHDGNVRISRLAGA